MPSKIPPFAFRPGKQRRALVEAWRAERGLSITDALLQLVDLGLGVNTQPAPQVRVGKEVAVPVRTGSVPLKEGVRLVAPSDDRARWDMFRTKPAKAK